MSAEIIQFVPKSNPKQEAGLIPAWAFQPMRVNGIMVCTTGLPEPHVETESFTDPDKDPA